jgi:hypothetical protein
MTAREIASARVIAEHAVTTERTARGDGGFTWSCSCGRAGSGRTANKARAAADRHVEAAFRKAVDAAIIGGAT